MTVLDDAHAAMEAGGEVERLRFYERLVDAELYVLLAEEAGEAIKPKVFPLEDGPVVLAFDRADRLAEFTGPAPFAEMTGRRLAPMLAEARLGLGLNLGVAPSAILLPADAMAWLADALSRAPEPRTDQPREVRVPNVPEVFLQGLDAKLPGLAGLAASAVLVDADYAKGRGLLLAFLDAVSEARTALARAVGEALIFSGLDAGLVDVTASGQIHHGVRTPAAGPHQLLHLLLNGGADGGVANVGVDLYQEVAADDHRLRFRVVDVGGDDGATAGDLITDELRGDVLR